MDHLIPDAPFEAMPQFMLLVVAIGALYYLMKGADWLVEGAAAAAARLGLPKVIVGATIVSLGTTSPEAAVSVMAAWQGQPGLALGNAVGSIIADTGLIFGLGCAIAVLPADRFVLKRQGRVDIGSAFLLAGLCYLMVIITPEGQDPQLGRWVGILLLALLVLYLYVSVLWSRGHREKAPDAADDSIPTGDGTSMLKLVATMLLGLILVVFSSRFLIGSVTVLAKRWGVPNVVIASTLVAFGTSLPEFMVGMTAIFRGHPALLVGNVIGADILNALFVVGAAAVAAPLSIIDDTAQVPQIFLYLHLPTMLVMICLLMVYIYASVRRGYFRRWYGYPLLFLYGLYVVLQYVLEAGGKTV